MHNPARDWYGAPLGALLGSVAGMLALGVITIPKAHSVGHLPVEDRRRAAVAGAMMSTFGAAVGAYLGASPHQRVIAAVGTALGSGIGAAAWVPSATEQTKPHGWQTGPVRGLLIFGMPVAGAAAAAAVAGSMLPSHVLQPPR